MAQFAKHPSKGHHDSCFPEAQLYVASLSGLLQRECVLDDID